MVVHQLPSCTCFAVYGEGWDRIDLRDHRLYAPCRNLCKVAPNFRIPYGSVHRAGGYLQHFRFVPGAALLHTDLPVHRPGMETGISAEWDITRTQDEACIPIQGGPPQHFRPDRVQSVDPLGYPDLDREAAASAASSRLLARAAAVLYGKQRPGRLS